MNIVLLLSSLVASAFAKDPCKMITTTVDPFKGPESSFVMPVFWSSIELRHWKDSDTFVIRIRKEITGASREKGAVGDLARFILGTQSFDFPTSTETLPVSNATPNGVFTEWKVPFEVNREQIATLATAPITTIGLMVGAQNFRIDLHEKQSKKLQTALTCLAESK